MPAGTELPTLHATAIACAGYAVLIRGASGAGKSDLALRCLATPVSPLIPHPVGLIADDRVAIRHVGAGLEASCPPALIGRIEVRTVGILDVPAVPPAPIALIADLVAPERALERLPERRWVTIDGIRVPSISLHANSCSAPLKLLLALLDVVRA